MQYEQDICSHFIHEIKSQKSEKWTGESLFQPNPQEGTVPKVRQITKTELCQKHPKQIHTNRKAHFHIKKICVRQRFQSFLYVEQGYFNEGTFLRGAFNSIQALLGNIQRLFTDFPKLVNFQGTDAF